MLMTKPSGRTASPLVAPVVVVVGDVQVAKVNVTEVGVVADEGGLPVVVEVVPRDGDPVGAADDVDLAVLRSISKLGSGKGNRKTTHVFIWPLGDIARKLVVVHPHPRRVSYRDAVVIQNKTNLQILDNHIRRVDDIQP